MPDPRTALDVRITARLRAALLEAFAQLQAGASRDALGHLLSAGVLTRSALSQALEALPAILQRAAAPLVTAATLDSAHIELQALARVHLDVSYTAVNPHAVAAAATQAGRLITRITAATRENIQRVIAWSIQVGLPPADAAALIRPMIGLTPQQGAAVINYRARLLADSPESIDVAGLDQAVTRYTARLLTQRATTIARTETIDALTSGQRTSWTVAQQQGVLSPTAKKEWIVTPDDRLCPLCKQMTGKAVLIAENFLTPLGPKPGPTMHANCRCALALQLASLALRAAA